MLGRPALLSATLLAALLQISSPAAQTYPSRPIRIVVPFAGGSSADATARFLAEILGKTWNVPVIVENRAGAGTIIGTELVTKSQPDGYTLLFTTSSLALNTSLYSKLPYDTRQDLIPVGGVTVSPFVIVVHPALPAKTVQDMVALSKSRPGAVTYGHSGTGSADHACVELLGAQSGIRVTAVPYRGTGPALIAVVAGEVQMAFASVSSALPLIQSGKVRALAVTSQKQSPSLPNVPPVSDSKNFSGFECGTWQALFAPARTPPDIVQKLSQAVSGVLKQKETVDRLSAQGLQPYESGPDEFRRFFRLEIDRWAKVLRQSGVRAD